MAFSSILNSNIYKIVIKVPTTCVLQAGSNTVGMQRFYAKPRVRYWPYPLDQKYRQERQQPLNPNSSGPLTDAPDFSYMDGRPAPPSSGQFRRMLQQQEIAQKVMQLCGEMNFAVERHAKLQVQKEEDRKRILAGKLKPKGKLLLQKK